MKKLVNLFFGSQPGWEETPASTTTGDPALSLSEIMGLSEPATATQAAPASPTSATAAPPRLRSYSELLSETLVEFKGEWDLNIGDFTSAGAMASAAPRVFQELAQVQGLEFDELASFHGFNLGGKQAALLVFAYRAAGHREATPEEKLYLDQQRRNQH